MTEHNLTRVFLSWSLPEGLAIAASAVYLVLMKITVPKANPIKSSRVRILSIVGFSSCALSSIYTVVIGGTWNDFILAEPIQLSAVLLFGVLVFRPSLISRSKLRLYLAVCVALSGICAVMLLWIAWSLTHY